MLMTPMTPNVIARPGGGQQQHRAQAETVINAFSSDQSCRLRSMPVIAVAAAAATAGLCPVRLPNVLRASISPRARNVATASRRSASVASGEASSAAARACSMRRLTDDRFLSPTRDPTRAAPPDRATGTPPRRRPTGPTHRAKTAATPQARHRSRHAPRYSLAPASTRRRARRPARRSAHRRSCRRRS